MTENQALSESGGDRGELPGDEARHRQVVADLDRLFRHAGQGVETRLLYQTVLLYRLEPRP